MEKWKLKEMRAIFDSLEPELAEDMRRLDYRLRTIATECSTFGIPIDVINAEQKKRVHAMMREIVKEHDKQDRKLGRRYT